jgi:hypothetical protein
VVSRDPNGPIEILQFTSISKHQYDIHAYASRLSGSNE